MCESADMLFHNYLERLIGSRISIRLVRALISHPGSVFTVRKLAKAASVSPSEAAIVAQQLEKYGILRIQPVGRSYLLTLNDESYILNKILRPMVKAEKDTSGTLLSILKANLDNGRVIRSAVLFGSVAAKSEREGIDIDLLVVSDDFDAASALASKAQERISLAFNGRLSPLIMSEKELKAKKNDKLLRSIVASDHITVAGRGLEELLEP